MGCHGTWKVFDNDFLKWDVDGQLSSRLLDSPSVVTDILEEHGCGEELPADKEGVCCIMVRSKVTVSDFLTVIQNIEYNNKIDTIPRTVTMTGFLQM